MRDDRTQNVAMRGGAWNPDRGLTALRDLLGRPGQARPRRGDVRTTILALLAERPMHGHQLVEEIEERSGGEWRPGAGQVYPTLQLLSDQGMVTVDETGERKMYNLTEEGRRAASIDGSSPRESPAARAKREAPALPKAGLKLAQALAQFGPGATPEQVKRAVDVVDDARRQLYAILAEG